MSSETHPVAGPTTTTMTKDRRLMRTTTKMGATLAAGALLLTGCAGGGNEGGSEAEPDQAPNETASPTETTPPAPDWQAWAGKPNPSSQLVPLVRNPTVDPASADTAPRWLEQSEWTQEGTEADIYTYYDDAEQPRNGAAVLIFPSESECEASGDTLDAVFGDMGYYDQVNQLFPEGSPSTMSNPNQMESLEQDTAEESDIGQDSGTLVTRTNADLHDAYGQGRAVTMNASIAQNPDGSYYTNSCSLMITDRNSTDASFKEDFWTTAVDETRESSASVSMTRELPPQSPQ